MVMFMEMGMKETMTDVVMKMMLLMVMVLLLLVVMMLLIRRAIFRLQLSGSPSKFNTDSMCRI